MARMNSPAAPVLHTILAQGHVSPGHRELSEVGGFSERTVSNVLADLGPRKLMVGGHPARLGPGFGMVLAVALGKESLRAGLVDANGDVHCTVSHPSSRNQLDEAPHHVMARIRAISGEVLARGIDEPALCTSKHRLKIVGASVAWPFPVDRAGRPVGATLRDPAWFAPARDTGKIPTLQERVSGALGKPFTTDALYAVNNANAHALGIAFRASRRRAGEPEHDQWRVGLVLRVSGSLGAATFLAAPHTERRLSFIDSRLIAGTNGVAGELGHLPVEKPIITARNKECPDGLVKLNYEKAECSCGAGRHHLEAFASADALLQRLEASGLEIPVALREERSVVRSIFDGEVSTRHVHALRDVGRILGRALASPILMLDPYSITLTGSLALEDLKQGVLLERSAWQSAIGDHVRLNHLTGEDNLYAGVRGAGLAMIRNRVYRQLEEILDESASEGLPRDFTSKHLRPLIAGA
jgi:predicted NBD/HSP70 family sugar kinase